MLEVLRRNATGWIAKILIGLLVLSFAVWGVADMVTGVGRTTVASVGSTEIGVTEFRRTYENQVNAFSRALGRRLTPDEAKRYGVEKRAIDQLVNIAAVDNQAKKLDLSITDQAVIAAVQADPSFKGIDGKFSQDRLDELIRQVGYTQQSFLVARRKDEVRGQLTSTLLSNVVAPKALLSMLHTFRDETRVARYFALDPKTAVKIPTPTGNDLKTTYDQNKAAFMTPEYRKVDVLMLTAADARKQIKVTDADLKAAYERDKSLFVVPETRHVLQLSFKDEAAATKARTEIVGGKSFEDVAKEQGVKPTDIDLGTLSKSQMVDPKIAKVAFSLEKDKVSEVVKGQFSTVLLMVKDIKPGRQPTLEEVKAQLTDRIRRLGTADEIRKLHDMVDDNRLAGKSLKDIGQLAKLTFHAIDGVDSKGNKPDGKPAFTSPDLGKIMRSVFAAEVGVESPVIELADNGYAWINLIAVTPQKQKPFESVRDDVRKLWEKNNRATALRKLAEEIDGRIKKGESFDAAAKSVSAEVKTTPAFKRGDSVPDLTAAAVTRIFALPLKMPAETLTTDGQSRLIFEVSEVKAPPKLSESEAKTLKDQVSEQMRSDILAEYVMALRKREGVSINQAAIDRATGATAQ